MQTSERSSWDRLKSEPSQPTVKRIRAFLVHLDWLREQVASTNPLTGIPAVKLHRFAAEARVLNVARMKELTQEKRFALAAALLFRQLAQAHDDGADMLIRQVQRIHHRAKELMKLRQASHLQQSAELVSTLRDVAAAELRRGSLQTILESYEAPQISIYAIYPETRHLSVKVRVFIDFLIERFGGSTWGEQAPNAR